MGNKVQGVLWDGKRHTHKSECKPTDADGDIVKHTQSQRVFGTLSGWIAFLPLTPENILSTPPLCGWQLPRQKLPRPYEQRTQRAASHTLWDAGCWLRVDQNSEQDTI